MILKLKYLKLLLIPIVLLITGCNNENTKEKDQSEKKEKERNHEDERPHEVALTEEQMKVMGIEIEKLNYQNISGYIRANGEVTINPDQESKVGSIIAGRVGKIYVKEGSYVRGGQTLAIIENPELINVQVEFIHSKNEYEYSKLEYERQLKLNRDNIGSKKILAELESNYKKALANYKTHGEKLASYKISKSRFDNIYEDTSEANLQRYYAITSPISGNVVKRNVTVGQYVEPSTDMFHIVNTSTVFVDLNVFEQDLPYISVGQKISLDVSVNLYEVYEGKVTYIDKIFDDEKRTVKVRASINNKREKLLPFMFVSAKIYINQESVLAVPISAIEAEGEIKYIFVKTNEAKEIDEHGEEEHKKEEEKNNENEHKKEIGIVFKKILINTGISDDKYIQVFPIEGLSRGGEIVTKGTFYLKSELQKSELEHHDH